MERYHSLLAIVIGKRTVADSDIEVTLLTQSQGKITALAKGAKNIRSRRLGSLQLGNLSKFSVYQKNQRFWVNESTTIASFLSKSKNLAQINLMFYLLETINQLIAENQQIDNVFYLVKDAINAINSNRVHLFIQTEINLLDQLGFGVPPEINTTFLSKNYQSTQRLIKKFTESIIEKPMESNKLFA